MMIRTMILLLQASDVYWNEILDDAQNEAEESRKKMENERKGSDHHNSSHNNLPSSRSRCPYTSPTIVKIMSSVAIMSDCGVCS